MWRHCVLCGAQGVWYEVGFHDFTQNPLCTCTRNVWTFAADGAFTNEFSSLCPSGKPLPTMSALNGAARLTRCGLLLTGVCVGLRFHPVSVNFTGTVNASSPGQMVQQGASTDITTQVQVPLTPTTTPPQCSP